ncbi:MAG TPA: CotH kinase family protein [Saprospiraceae bacterium]|nr:CotH kinase family protein [Saprospiraceae bacterium]
MKIFRLAVFMLLVNTLFGQVVINEYSASNLRQFADNFGKYEDWIELYNKNDKATDISGWYLSDRDTKPKKWQIPAGTVIPAKGYLVIWASGRDLRDTVLHTNFKFSQTKGDEFVVLSNAGGTILESSPLIITQLHHSVVKNPVNGKWMICTEPTFFGENTEKNLYNIYASKPKIEVNSGFYADSVTITMSNLSGEAIRYTINGGLPNENDNLYTGPITIKNNMVVSARSFSTSPDVYPGFTDYKSYFINEPKSTLPIISVGGGESLITLAEGDVNQNPIGSIEVFSKEGVILSKSYGELDKHGQDSWVNEQRSLDWISRDEMGHDNGIKQKLFHGSERDEYQRIILRASGDDNYPATDAEEHDGSTHMRDEYVHTMVKKAGMHLDIRSAERYQLFLNGKYWGIYAIREKPDDHDYTQFNYKQDKHDLQFLKTWGSSWSEYGEDQAFKDWGKFRDFILNNDVSQPIVYKSITDQLDVVSLMDYMIANLSFVSVDWLNYNTGWWRGLNPEGTHKKWGYIMWDNDATCDYYINYTGVPDTSPNAKACDIDDISTSMDGFFPSDSMLVQLPADSIFIDGEWIYFEADTFWLFPDPGKHEKIFLKLLNNNQQFKNLYFGRYADILNTTFNCDAMLATIDSITNQLRPEMPRQIGRWGGTMNEWLSNVNDLRDFISKRCTLISDGLISCYDLTGPHQITILTDPPNSGTINFNSLTHESLPWQGNYFGNMSNTISVSPKSGKKFLYWKSLNGTSAFESTSAVSTSVNLLGQDTLVAIFEGATNTNNASFDANIHISPNPADNQIVIKTSDVALNNANYTIHDISGKIVQSGAISGSNESYKLETTSLSSGTYFISIQTINGNWVSRFIIMR